MILFLTMVLVGNFLAETAFAQTSEQLVRAYYFKWMPSDYKKQELLVASLRDTGANTLILELPMNEQGYPDLRKIPNSVYLAHQAGLEIHIVLPTRQYPGILSRHGDWEDNRYALGSGTVQPTGKLDLFNRAAVEYLTSLAKEIASYSVDALLLGPDFYYAPTEGIGPAALEQTNIDLKWAPDPRTLFQKVRRGAEGTIIEEYGEDYGKWTGFKRDRLLYVFDQIRKAGRSVKGGLKLGVPIPIVMPVTTADRIFTQFAYDINAFRKLNTDYYWTAIEYREIRTRLNVTSRQSMELLSRIANSAVTAVKMPDQVILALQATTDTGSVIPLFEMEEITGLVRSSGKTGIAYIMGPNAMVNRIFMKKIFNVQAQP
jgi:hypothetical protein